MLEVRAVTKRKDAVAALYEEVLLDDDAPRAVHLTAAVLDEVLRTYACRPDDRLGGDDLTVLEDQIVAVIRRHCRIEADIDALFAQDINGVLLQVGRHHRQNGAHRLKQCDMHLREVNVMELFLEYTDELHNGACHLDARRTAADDDEVEVTTAFLCSRRIGLLRGALELMHDMPAQGNCLLQRLHGIGIALDALVSEEIRRAARREDKVVVSNLAVIRQQDAASLIDARRLRHEEVHVVVVLEKGTRRIGDLSCRKYRRAHLIEQRLKQMVVVTVNERNAYILLCQLLGKAYAAKPRTNDDDMLLICHDKSPFQK